MRAHAGLSLVGERKRYNQHLPRLPVAAFRRPGGIRSDVAACGLKT
jgi:hypothetical protein